MEGLVMLRRSLLGCEKEGLFDLKEAKWDINYWRE